MASLSRRELLVVSAAAGGGLLLGWRVDARPTDPATAATFAPNQWIRIGKDGRVTIVVSQVEMGQGTFTSMPMLVAEELEVELGKVQLEHAPPDEKVYGLPGFGVQVTGASTSVRLLHQPLRKAGATARTMLITAAAQTWNVDPTSCQARKGAVIHVPTRRTLSYGALAEKASRLPVPTEVTLKDPREYTLIGTAAKRLDGPSKVNGSARFGIDVRLPGMKFAALAISPVVGGKLASLDDGKAKAIKGVRQVVRLEDAVAVVGDNFWAASEGLRALSIRWEDGPNGTVGTADVVKGLAEAAGTAGVQARNVGDAQAVLAAATRRIEADYEVAFRAHAALEPLNCTVHVRPDLCEVWTGNQRLPRARAFAAEACGLPVEKVLVHNQYLGGAFGRRLEADYIPYAVRIARQVEGPVQVIWSRKEDTQHDVYGPYYYSRFSAALDARGQPAAWMHRVVGPSILARWLPPAFKDGIDGDAVDGARQLLYDLPAIRVEYVRHETPVLATGFWRGVGVTHNNFVVESFLDELAVAARQDPVAYRRALLGKSPRARAVLDRVAEASGWGKPLPAGRGRGVAVQYSDWDTYLAAVAEVSVSEASEIRVHRVVCAVDCGSVVNPDTVRAQVEGGIIFGISGALWGEITIEKGRVQQSNFHDYRVLRINEAPAIEVHLIPSTEAPGGMGEPPTAVTAPAIANALFAATGKRIRKWPLERNLGQTRGQT
jgi:isoquinoline 1-oxidoreductase subunit beta